jgi:hypothetical protein
LDQFPLKSKERGGTRYPLLLTAALGALLLALSGCSRPETPVAAKDVPTVLLFDGAGASTDDVAAFETILRDQHFNYTRANSRQLNAMNKDQLLAFGLLIVPGGNFEKMGGGITTTTAATVRDAVHGGLNYLGVCAGAFFAGDSPYNGLDLTGGVLFNFHSLERQNIRKAVVAISVGGSSTFDH